MAANVNRSPIVTETINLSYSNGIYSFFCKNIAKLFILIMSIFSFVKDPVQRLAAVQYEGLIRALWIVNHNANKLQGISSISSSVHDNFFCKCRQDIENCICQYCYAYNQQSYQTGLKEHNIINGLVLRNVLIPVEYFRMLVILFPYLRIESFGDVANVIQARNYIRIIKAFPEKRCAIWSKNIMIWKQAFDIEGKPGNTTFVFSSSFLNRPESERARKYWFVDHVFTVFTKKYAKEHNININCGGRKCLECILAGKACYHRGTDFEINELKK